MKAPEKIYIDHHPFLDEYEEYWYPAPTGDKSVEYTRTDAFIEEAWSWIENNILSSNQQDKSRLYFEQFKNYIEGGEE